MTKTYIAKSVDEAMARARAELGAEAALLNTRRVPSGYEVVFSLPQEPAGGSAADQGVRPTFLHADLERLHSQLDEIRTLLTPAGRTAPELAEVYDRLIGSDVDPALSKDIVDRLEAQRLRRQDSLEVLIRAELARRVSVDPSLDGEIVALVGPPGGGKTTTFAKVASLVSNRTGRRPVRLMALDSSTPELQEIAETLGASFTRVPAANLLPSLVAEARKTEFLLIDTPGYAPTDRQAAEATAGALAECPGADTHLVAPGYMKPIDLRRCIQRYKIFRPSKLLVTKLDETHSFGSVFSEAARAALALSFLAHGPMIPRDIRPATSEDLLALALERHPARSLHVA